MALFYHSNAEPPGVAGVCRVAREGYPDLSTPEVKGDWSRVDVEFIEKFRHFVSLEEIKRSRGLAGMLLVRRGMRLSVQPVEKVHFDEVVRMGRGSFGR